MMNVDQNNAMEKILQGVLYRASCPEPDTLLRFALGDLPSAELSAFKRHLQDCPHCAGEAAMLAVAPAEADGWLARARRWMQGLVGDVNSVISATSQRPTQLAFAVKGESDSPHIFSGGAYRISLTVQSGGLQKNGHRIEGSVVNTEDPLAEFAGQVYLTNVDNETRSESLDDFGFFVVDDLPSATYTLLIMLPERSVWIESFEIA